MSKKILIPRECEISNYWEEDAIPVHQIRPGNLGWISKDALVFDKNTREGYVILEKRSRRNPTGPYRIGLNCIKQNRLYAVNQRHIRLYGWRLEDVEELREFQDLAKVCDEDYALLGQITTEIKLERRIMVAENNEEYEIAAVIREELLGIKNRSIRKNKDQKK